jgi:hypothetical protein
MAEISVVDLMVVNGLSVPVMTVVKILPWSPGEKAL